MKLVIAKNWFEFWFYTKTHNILYIDINIEFPYNKRNVRETLRLKPRIKWNITVDNSCKKLTVKFSSTCQTAFYINVRKKVKIRNLYN